MDSFIFHFALLLLAVSPVVIQTSNICNDYYNKYYFFPEYYSYLYLKFEEALIKDHKKLEELRTAFMSSSAAVSVYLYTSMSVMNVANNTCDFYSWYQKPEILTFCPAETSSSWDICNDCYLYSMKLVQKKFSSLKLAATEQNIFKLITFVSLIHGSVVSAYWPAYVNTLVVHGEYNFFSNRNIGLKLDNLTCNPSCALTQCVLSELFSWVSYCAHMWQHMLLESTL